jgi:flagellar biosynthesis/type III secretory pathway protein FliH
VGGRTKEGRKEGRKDGRKEGRKEGRKLLSAVRISHWHVVD